MNTLMNAPVAEAPTTAELAMPQAKPPGLGPMAAWVAVGALAFHGAYAWRLGGPAVVGYLFALVQLARAATWRGGYYCGLAVGLAIAAGRLDFFWRIFSAGSIALWYVYAFWIGLFVALSGACLRRFGPRGWLVVPFLWTGLEYFRSELYYLRFSWLNPGYAFGGAVGMAPLGRVGMYGAGFVLACVACAAALVWGRSRGWAVAALGAGAGGFLLWGEVDRLPPRPGVGGVHIAGVQLESPSEGEVLLGLGKAIREHPEAEVIVLSECTFDGPVPAKVRDWCRRNRRYLVAGGGDPAPGKDYYNTAFVAGPDGEIAFRQAKSVPIQFFKDGLRAPDQRLWASPWGKIGLCICYDLSYTRVTDRLVDLGAEALIVPTMDVVDWGRRQHELHARVAPVRAAEYGVPIFRLASSGISQCVERSGRVAASAPCPGPGAILYGTLQLGGPGRLPLDRWLAPLSVLVTGLTIGWLGVVAVARRRQKQ